MSELSADTLRALERIELKGVVYRCEEDECIEDYWALKQLVDDFRKQESKIKSLEDENRTLLKRIKELEGQKIEAVENLEKKMREIFVVFPFNDMKTHKVPDSITGSELYSLVHIPANCDLFLAVQGTGDDELILNSSKHIEVREGSYFYTALRNI